MNTEVVYGIFKRYVSDGQGSELPEKFEDLPERDQQNITALYKEFVLAWVDNEFKAALCDQDRMTTSARVLILAFKAKKDNAINALKFSIADFVMQLVEHPCIEEARVLMDMLKEAAKGE